MVRGRVISESAVRDTFGFGVAVDTNGRAPAVPASPIVSDFYEYRVATTDWWGGAPRDTLVVRTPTATSMCGTPLTVGESYVLSTNARTSGIAYIGACNPMSVARLADRLIAQLDSTARRVRRP